MCSGIHVRSYNSNATYWRRSTPRTLQRTTRPEYARTMEFHELLANWGRSFLFALATLLPILNPPAVAPIFLSLTEGASTQARTELSRRVAINIFIMLAIAMFAGNVVLDFFGVSLP